MAWISRTLTGLYHSGQRCLQSQHHRLADCLGQTTDVYIYIYIVAVATGPDERGAREAASGERLLTASMHIRPRQAFYPPPRCPPHTQTSTSLPKATAVAPRVSLGSELFLAFTAPPPRPPPPATPHDGKDSPAADRMRRVPQRCPVLVPRAVPDSQCTMTPKWIHAFQFLRLRQFGPNATTWLLPAELAPTQVRSLCHGFLAAVGKAGALVAGVVFALVDNRTKFWISVACGEAGVVLTLITTPHTTGGPSRAPHARSQPVPCGAATSRGHQQPLSLADAPSCAASRRPGPARR
jgi:hypothetical protein